MYKVGDKVVMAIEEGSNASRRIKISLKTKSDWIFPVEVIKVGRKYITVRKPSGIEFKFDINDEYREVYEWGGADYRLYPTENAVIEKFLANALHNKIRSAFSDYGETRYSLSQLKAIAEILNIEID